jgi:hypothetical protein
MNETYWLEEDGTPYGCMYQAMRERWAAVVR